MIEKWRKTLGKDGETAAVLTDLCKAFDCIDHNLLIAKLDVCGFEKQSICVSKERKSILHTVCEKFYFQVSLKALY